MFSWLTATFASLALASSPSSPASASQASQPASGTPSQHVHVHADAPAAKGKRYRCKLCEHIYDPAVGEPHDAIPPGTPFEKLPDTWHCPECGAAKDEFELLED